MLEEKIVTLASANYVQLGLIELGDSNYKNAIEQFNKAIQEFPESHNARLGRVLALMLQFREYPPDKSEAMLIQIIYDLEYLLENSKKMLENIKVPTK